MKYWITIFLSFIIGIHINAQTTKTVYACPMKCEKEKTYTKPGKCPVCGMDLKAKQIINKKTSQKKTTIKKPATKKPQQEKLKIDSSVEIHQDHQMHDDTSIKYICPMHPEVVSDKPGTCPKCGMDLVKKETKQADMKMDHNVHQQHEMKDSFDFGNNDHYTPFTNFSIPVLKSTPLQAPYPKERIANREGDITNKQIEAANAGIHFKPGTEGARTVRYDLYITDTIVNYSGKNKHAIAVNGQLPAPPLVFTIGDTALIYVHNNADKPSAVHWHGVQLANRMDGVPNMTQLSIPPHTTYIYKFPVVQSGTYWYHSHFKLQEQIGLYGALIFNKRTEPDLPTIPVILSEWSDLKPQTINRYLHNANDWFGIKKNAVQSYGEAISEGAVGIKLKNEWLRMNAMDVSDVYYEKFLINGKPSSELSTFKAGDKIRLRIVNGGGSSYFWVSFSGSKLKVIGNDGNDVMPVEVDRLIIGTAETYDVIVTLPENKKYELLITPEDRTQTASLWLGSGEEVAAKQWGRLDYFAGMKMMNSMMKLNGDMKPMDMPMSLQKMDMNKVMYPELKSTSQMDEHAGNETMEMQKTSRSTYTCPMHPEVKSDKPGTCPKCGMDLVAKKNDAVTAMFTCPMHPEVVSDKPGTCPKCRMDLEMKKENEHAGMDMSTQNGISTLNYDMLQSTHPTVLPEGNWRDLKFVLEGNMNRYVWTLDNKTVGESDKILIRKGENLRIILHNNSMMRHPMHLHGHDFRTLNKYGTHSPLKNVLDILPMETDTLEFHASEDGDWFFHCHILYHMMSGMGRVFSYQNSTANPEIPDPQKAYRDLKRDDRMFHFMIQNDFATNGNDGMMMYANTRWAFQSEWRIGYMAHHGYEIETHFGRYLGKMQWLYPYVGIDFRYRKGEEEEKNMFGQTLTKDSRKVFHAGIQYTLPMLLVADASVDHTGNFRLQLSREDIPLTRRARAMFMINSDREYMFGAKYIITRHLAPSFHYDSDMGWGGGITISY